MSERLYLNVVTILTVILTLKIFILLVLYVSQPEEWMSAKFPLLYFSTSCNSENFIFIFWPDVVNV